LWEIDLAGILDDKGKNKFIFVAIDHYTKWVETRVINHKSGEEITKAVKELIIDKHGTPKRILTDCGREFSNSYTKSLEQKYGIKWEFASPFHHQTTGAVERVIQTLMNKIKKLTEFGIKSWRVCVERATLAVNLSFNRALGTSPFIFKYGRLPELDIDKDLFQPRILVSKVQLRNQKKTIFKKYRQQIVKGKVEQNRNFKVGDFVLIFRKPQNKLDANWQEGYKIKEILSNDAYIVEKKGKTFRVNKRHIRWE
jgi:Integrase core domain